MAKKLQKSFQSKYKKLLVALDIIILSQYNDMALKNKEAGISLSNAIDLDSAIWCLCMTISSQYKHSYRVEA